jgi:hypothetical protein
MDSAVMPNKLLCAVQEAAALDASPQAHHVISTGLRQISFPALRASHGHARISEQKIQIRLEHNSLRFISPMTGTIFSALRIW